MIQVQALKKFICKSNSSAVRYGVFVMAKLIFPLARGLHCTLFLFFSPVKLPPPRSSFLNDGGQIELRRSRCWFGRVWWEAEGEEGRERRPRRDKKKKAEREDLEGSGKFLEKVEEEEVEGGGGGLVSFFFLHFSLLLRLSVLRKEPSYFLFFRFFLYVQCRTVCLLR